jgi:hypothetical protein
MAVQAIEKGSSSGKSKLSLSQLPYDKLTQDRLIESTEICYSLVVRRPTNQPGFKRPALAQSEQDARTGRWLRAGAQNLEDANLPIKETLLIIQRPKASIVVL